MVAETTGINVGADELPIDIDGTFAANSDTLVASQKAAKTFMNAAKAAAIAACTAAPVAAPGTASSAGVAGQWAYDATHIYVCIATNTWVRATLATF
jgi:hypothetical protein